MFITKAVGLSSIKVLEVLKRYNIFRYPEVIYSPKGEINDKINKILSSIEKSKPWVITSFSRGSLQRNEIIGNRSFVGYDSLDIATKVRNVSMPISFNFFSNSMTTIDRIEEMFVLYFENDIDQVIGTIEKEYDGNTYEEKFLCNMCEFANGSISDINNNDYGALYQYNIEFKLEFSVEDKLEGGPTPRIKRIYVNDELCVSVDDIDTGFAFKFLS